MEEPRLINSFVGTYSCSVDKKGRIMIPAKFRHAIPNDLKDVLIISKSKDNCLDLYPLPHWNRIINKLMDLRPGREKRDIIRFYSENSQQVGIDKAGRVALPPKFLEELGSPKQIIMVGMLTYMEIWSPEQYEAMAKTAKETFMKSEFEFE